MYALKRSSKAARPGFRCLMRSNFGDDILYLVIAAICVDLREALFGVDMRKDFSREKPARHLGEPVEGLGVPSPGVAVFLVSELPVRVVPNVRSRPAGLRLVILLVRMVVDVNPNHPWLLLLDQTLDD